ncbi:MAG: tRNA pseudouridine(38-40) synthase TruA [Candidatus Hydrogenedentes bacterium]|nr:tRNA pseudouridine(38-40) synthase TruA [Candidatus Hydrogenedentota bacterium]
MTQTIKGIVRYDGTDFMGWQRQSHGRTVQGEIENVLSRIADEPVTIQGAGRTDAGVHALGQVFSCVWPKDVPPRLCHALNRMLMPEVQLLSLVPAEESFNARFAARSKHYGYAIQLGASPDPFAARYAWHVPYALDLPLMQALAATVVGEHDFAGFESTGSQRREHTVRRIFSATLEPGAIVGPQLAANCWHFHYHGDGFLYHMVRNLTGTLVEIGRGRFPAEFFAECLHSPGPFKGHCAPAQGLFLKEVQY